MIPTIKTINLYKQYKIARPWMIKPIIMRSVIVEVLLLLTVTKGNDLLDDWFADFEAFESMSGDCTGGGISLRHGEGTILRSHPWFGRRPHPANYSCGWTVQPEQCDLGVRCKVNLGNGRVDGSCNRGDDYVRLMKGGGAGIGFHHKYCGKESIDLNFSGEDPIHSQDMKGQG